jgi:hypothetical protein
MRSPLISISGAESEVDATGVVHRTRPLKRGKTRPIPPTIAAQANSTGADEIAGKALRMAMLHALGAPEAVMVSPEAMPEPALTLGGDAVVVAARDCCCGPLPYAINIAASFVGVLIIGVQPSCLGSFGTSIRSETGGSRSGNNRHQEESRRPGGF